MRTPSPDEAEPCAAASRLTHCVDFFEPGKVPLNHGAETYILQIADAIAHGEPIKPFRSNIIKRLKARRAKGIKWSEDEALADSERMPWHFDDTSSEESSSEDDDDEPAAKRKREK